MATTAYCTECGARVEEDWDFCEDCGAAQQAALRTAASTVSATDGRMAPTIRVAASPVTIGRSPDCDVALADRDIAMRHAVVAPGPDGIHFRDLGRTSGTRLNGVRCKHGVLAPGDELGVGHRSWRRVGNRLVPDNREFPPLEAEAVEVKAGTTTLLQPTSLTMGKGEVVAIIGPSGSGKSTLLKALGGVRPRDGGSVLVRGGDVGLRQADIGYVPQDDTLHHLLSIKEALSFAARLRLAEDHTKEERERVIAGVLQQVDLADIGDRRIGNLSGGQRKRAAVALELISDPELLLLDEPTTGLDPGLERRLMEVVRRIADRGHSVLLVTHATQSLDLCDRVAIMAPGGRLAYLGAPSAAPAAFGVERFEDLYAQLESEAGGGTAPGRPDTTIAPSRSATARAVPRRRIWPQVRVLIRRYSLLFARDRRNAKILAAQVLILAAISAFLFGSDVFAYDGDGRTSHAGQSAQLLFLMVTVSIWFGAISSARQIVSERGVLTRELAAGVRTEAYLISKSAVLGIVATVQTALFVWLVLGLRPIDRPPENAELEIMLVCVLVSWVGVGLGLTLSAFARSENQATSFLPLILLPQLLFGGAIVTTKDLAEPMRSVSHLAASQWGFAGAGNAVDMSGRIADDPAFARVTRYSSNFFNHGVLQVTVALLLMVTVCAAVLQARLRPSFEDTWWRQGVRWWERWLQARRTIG
jgi:ABC transport system ATP-binding/permease protein